MKLLLNPYDWHVSPDHITPCPVCGSGVAGKRSHRRMRSDRTWISRGTAQPVAVQPPDDTK